MQDDNIHLRVCIYISWLLHVCILAFRHLSVLDSLLHQCLLTGEDLGHTVALTTGFAGIRLSWVR